MTRPRRCSAALSGSRPGAALKSDLAALVTATIHLSATLRSRTDEDRLAQRHAFTEDLPRVVAQILAS